MKAIHSLILSFFTVSFLVELISSEELPPCAQDQLYKIEYYHKVKNNTYTKLNTTLRCQCDVKYKESSPKNYVPDDENPKQYLLRINCTKDNTKELVNKTTCKPEEECQHDIWEDYGKDNPRKKYKDYSVSFCKCNGSRRCLIESEANLRTIYTCKALYKELPNKICPENAVSKVEYFRELKSAGNNSSLIKRDTLFICRCDAFQSYITHEPVKDTKDGRNWIVDSKCPNKFFVENDYLKSCNTGELCGIDHFRDYGAKRPKMSYFDYTSKLCICDRFRECVPKGRNEGDFNYYCELKSTDLSYPPTCGKAEIYKEEVHLGILKTAVPEDLIKMNTQFRCHCDVKKMKSSLLHVKSYPGRNTLIQEYECIERRYAEIGNCFEYQICQRDFIYEYGKDREGKQYVDTSEQYCRCQNGMECKPVGKLSTYFSTAPYDEVLSYRCMKKKSKKLKPCKKNQTYMVEIHHREKRSSQKPLRLNTFIKCICDSPKDGMPGMSDTRKDIDNPDNQWVTTYFCPRDSRPVVMDPCIDYGVCQRSVRLNAGLEDPDGVLTQYFTTYCDCEPGFSCENVGGEGNTTIHRCVKNKSSSKLEVCKGGEVFRINVDWFVNYYSEKIRGYDNERKRLNTFQECACLENVDTTSGEIIIKDTYLDRYSDRTIVQKYKCPKKDSKAKEVTLPYCKHSQICKTQYFEKVGSEKPDSIIKVNNSTENCTCSSPGNCRVTEQPNPFAVVSRCVINETETPILRRCIPGQLFKEEIYGNTTMPNGKFGITKLHTILKCVCEQILYNIDEKENINVTQDPTDKHQWISSFYCPLHASTAIEVDPCMDYSICRIDIHTDYGLNFGPDVKYLKTSHQYCTCDRDRICNISEKGYPPGASTTYDTYRCVYEKKEPELPPCTENQDFLVEVNTLKSDKSTKVKLNTYLMCACNHNKDSHEALEHRSETDPSNPDQMISTYTCSVDLKPFESETCSENDVCLEERHDYYGRERTGEVFLVYSKKLCKCGISSVCVPDKMNGTITSYKCAPK